MLPICNNYDRFNNFKHIRLFQGLAVGRL